VTQLLARVTIHNGSYDEYQALHKSMLAIGFRRYIAGGNGIQYWLPDATYVGESNKAPVDVAAHVSRIAAQCAPSKTAPEAFVCVWTSAAWQGLRQAT
jgi:hypothetical protein